jgi:2Fe-2S ferredoxin
MPKLTITNTAGETRSVDVPINTTVMEAIRNEGFSDLQALCGGCCSCATCHVYVQGGNLDSLPAVSEDEEILLSASAHLRANSRLSCQIRMSPALDGLAVQVALAD